MADPENEPDFYSISRLFPLNDADKVNSTTVPTPALGVQSQLNPLFGGISNFQQLSPSLLGMPKPAPLNGQQESMNMDATTGINNFGNLDRLMAMNMGMSNSMAPQVGNATVPSQPGQNLNDPQLLAALFQQQQQQPQPQQMLQQQQTQQQSAQRAQSSFMRYM